jgi:hypothetical protein
MPAFLFRAISADIAALNPPYLLRPPIAQRA